MLILLSMSCSCFYPFHSLQLVDTTVEIANKVGGAEIVSRVVEDLKDENEQFRKMVMDCLEKVNDTLPFSLSLSLSISPLPPSSPPLSPFHLCCVCVCVFARWKEVLTNVVAGRLDCWRIHSWLFLLFHQQVCCPQLPLLCCLHKRIPLLR